MTMAGLCCHCGMGEVPHYTSKSNVGAVQQRALGRTYRRSAPWRIAGGKRSVAARRSMSALGRKPSHPAGCPRATATCPERSPGTRRRAVDPSRLLARSREMARLQCPRTRSPAELELVPSGRDRVAASVAQSHREHPSHSTGNDNPSTPNQQRRSHASAARSASMMEGPVWLSISRS